MFNNLTRFRIFLICNIYKAMITMMAGGTLDMVAATMREPWLA